MRILIETYRSWDIYFDSSDEQFYTLSDYFDHDARKKTFSAVKTYIDQFIKDNLEFKPFYIEHIEYGHTTLKQKVIGIRKDGRFVVEKNGKPTQLSEYEEKNWMLYNPENEKVFTDVALLCIQIDTLKEKIKEEKAKLIIEDVKSIKAKFIQNA